MKSIEMEFHGCLCYGMLDTKTIFIFLFFYFSDFILILFLFLFFLLDDEEARDTAVT